MQSGGDFSDFLSKIRQNPKGTILFSSIFIIVLIFILYFIFSEDDTSTPAPTPDPTPEPTSTPEPASRPGKCSSNPCLNNAKCIDVDENNYICACPSGYSGINCEDRASSASREIDMTVFQERGRGRPGPPGPPGPPTKYYKCDGANCIVDTSGGTEYTTDTCNNECQQDDTKPKCSDCNKYGVYLPTSIGIFKTDGTLLKPKCSLYYERPDNFGGVVLGPEYTNIYNLLNEPLDGVPQPTKNPPFTIVYSGIIDNSKIDLIKNKISTLTLPDGINAYSIEKNNNDIYMVFAKNYPTSDIECESNQITGKCYTGTCSPGIEAFQVGGYSYQIKNNTKDKILTSFPGLSDKLPSNCKEDDCVIFNTKVTYTTKDDITINPSNIKCIPKINGNCLPNFNIITDQTLGNCPFDSVYLGDSVPTSINGSNLEQLCLSRQFNTLSSEKCKTLFEGDNLEGKCPWIGYNLFSGGDNGKGVDGTYTFNDNKPTKPYWCFSDSGEAPDAGNECTGMLIPTEGGDQKGCDTITDIVECPTRFMKLNQIDGSIEYQQCKYQDPGGGGSCVNSEKACTLPPQ